jgi:peroxiredoxin
MHSVVLAARLILAAVFVVAAIGKLADLPGSRASLVGFGLPQRASAVLGTLLPLAELAVAVALIAEPSAQWGAAGALALLLAFVTGIGTALRRGEAPPCNCFGAIHSAPASRTTLVRNVVLAAVAGVALGWGPGPSIGSWVSDRSAAELVAVLAGAAALALLAAAIPLWLANRRLSARLTEADARIDRIPFGLPIGSLAPEFSVPDGEGGMLRLSSLVALGKPVILVFTVAGCGPCEPLLPELRRLQSIAADRVTVALVGISTVERYDRLRETHGEGLRLLEAIERDPVLAQELEDLSQISHLYGNHHSPAALVVTTAGTIGSVMVDGRLAIQALIRRTLDEAPPTSALLIAEPALVVTS